MSDSPSIITRLGYDPSSNKKGLDQARQDVANYKAQVVLIDTELKRARVQLATEFSADNRKQTADRINDLRSELATATAAIRGKRGVEKQAALENQADVKAQLQSQLAILNSYEQQKIKIGLLAAAQVEASSKARQAQAAAGVFREAGRATGEIPGVTDLLQNLAPGLMGIQTRLSAIFSGMVMLSGGVKGGTDEIIQGTTAAEAGVEGLGIGLTGLVSIGALSVASMAAVGAAMFKAGSSATSWAHQLTLLSAETGLSTDELQKLEFAGKTAGLELEDLLSATKILSKAVTEGSPVLAKLGIATRDANGEFRSAFDVLIDLSKALQNVSSEAEKVDISRQVLGKGGQILLPLLEQGPQALMKLFAVVEQEGVKNVAELNEVAHASEEASARLELSFHKVESRMGFTVGLWASLKNAAASYFASIDKHQEQLDKGELIGIEGGVSLPVPGADTLPPSPAAPVPPENLLTRYTVRTPPPESKELTTAREELSAAQSKELTSGQRLINAQAELNKLKSEEAKLDAQKASGINVDTELTANLKDQKTQVTVITEVRKQYQEAALAIARTEAEIAAHLNDQLPAAKQQKQMAQDRINTIDEIKIPRLRAQEEELGPLTPENEKAKEGIESEINSLLKERSKLYDELVTKQNEVIKLSENQKLNQKLSNEEQVKQLNKDVGIELLPDVPATALASSKKELAALNGPLPPNKVDEFFNSLGNFSDIVGKFNAGLSSSLSRMFALVEAFRSVTAEMEALSSTATKSGSFLGGLKDLISGKKTNDDGTTTDIGGNERVSGILKAGGAIGGAVQGLQGAYQQGGLSGVLGGALSGAELGSLAGPLGAGIGAVVGGITGVIGSIFNGAKKQTAKLAQQLGDNINKGVTDFKASFSTITGVADQIKAVNDEQARFQAQWTSTWQQLISRKGGNDEIAKMAPGIIQQQQEFAAQITQLLAQQKQLNEQFTTKTAILTSPEGARDTIQNLADIADAVKQMTDAGHDATDTMAFLNASLGQLTANLGRGLRQDEQDTINLLLQEIDLQKQRADVVSNADDQINAIKQRAGLSRALSPAQQAAVDIANVKKQRDEQLKAIDEQDAQLKAEIGARAQLFNLDNDRNDLLAKQLGIEQEITAEIEARIAEQESLYDQLAAGLIPSLPEGLIPGGSSNYNWNINGATIQIVLPSDTALTPQAAADIVRKGLESIGRDSSLGLSV